MKNLNLLLFSLFISITSFSQTPSEYHRVEISLTGKNINDLFRTGAITGEGRLVKGLSYTEDLPQAAILKLKEEGWSVKTKIKNVQSFEPGTLPQLSKLPPALACNSIEEWAIPVNFSYGSMGGYLTYDEVMQTLDEMKAKFPNLISVKEIISETDLTHEGRPLHFVRISDNPDTRETDEPNLLYTSLTHAREPMSMTQLMYFMWYLLENYDTNPEIKYLVDELELYFIPVVNPDGYIYNQMNHPSGGGLWRKNRRVNGDGTIGVDLNRNFGHTWGYDNSGSSPDPASDVYRGEAPFSEPETRNLRDFVLEYDPGLILNYHSFGDLLIRPFAHIPSLVPADIQTFDAWGHFFASEYDFSYGNLNQTLGYPGNGGSDDYFYGELGIVAYTPEVGPSFWPITIISGSQSTMSMNLYAARFMLDYCHTTELSSHWISSLTGNIDFRIQKIGRLSGEMDLHLTPLTGNIISGTQTQTVPLDHLDTYIFSPEFELDSDIQDGDEIQFELASDNGIYSYTKTISKIFKTQNINVDSADGDWFSYWNSSTGNWSETNETYFSPSTCMTDSPFGDYSPGNFNLLDKIDKVDLTSADDAYITFKTKWDMGNEDAYVKLFAIREDGSENPLCGLYSNLDYIAGESYPAWKGNQLYWVEERISLLDFLGEKIDLRFFLSPESPFESNDGFYFDDFKIFIQEKESTSIIEADELLRTIHISPNPTSSLISIQSENPIENIEIFNVQGISVFRKENINQATIELELSSLSDGLYLIRVNGVLSERIVIHK